jgi:hypothetical protein
MSGSTATEGYPYPFTTDFGDVQDAYRLAMAVDADVRAEQAPFRAFENRPAFVGRQSSNGSGFLSGTDLMKFGTIDYDTTGGVVLNATSWKQPTSQGPSWWLFGGTMLTFNGATPVVGDLCMGRIQVSTTDQVSNVVTTTNAYQRNDESNTGGEWLNVFTMAPIYRASVSIGIILSGSTTKGLSAGSTFWGCYLGPVI